MNKRRIAFYFDMAFWVVCTYFNPAVNISMWVEMYPWTVIGNEIIAEMMHGKW